MKMPLTRKKTVIEKLQVEVADLKDELSKRLALINAQTKKIQDTKQETAKQLEEADVKMNHAQQEIDFLKQCLADLGVEVEPIKQNPAAWDRSKRLLQFRVREISIGEDPDYTNKYQLNTVLQFIESVVGKTQLDS